MESLFDTPAATVTEDPAAPPEMPKMPTPAAPPVVSPAGVLKICATCRHGMSWGGEGDTPAGWVCYGREFANQERGVPPAIDPNAVMPCWCG